MDRRTRHEAVPVLSVGRRRRVPGPRTAAQDHRRRRDATWRRARGADRRRLEHVRRQLRDAPAALPRGVGRRREAPRGPDGHRRLPG